MLAAYIVAAIVGGGMIALSALAGLGLHADASGMHFDHPGEAGGGLPSGDVDTSHDLSSGDHATDTGDGSAGLWLPFLSLRFWTYCIGTFGLVGTVLSLARVSLEPVTAIIAVASGLLMGTVAAGVVHYLTKAENSAAASQEEFLGAIARVTVPIGELPGKVRTSIRGDIIDLVAQSHDGQAFTPGEEVMIIGYEGNKVQVARQSEFLGE